MNGSVHLRLPPHCELPTCRSHFLCKVNGPCHKRGVSCMVAKGCPMSLSFMKEICHLVCRSLINAAWCCWFWKDQGNELLLFSLKEKLKCLNPDFFSISLWNASGQGYSNGLLFFPVIQSPIIIWLSFVAFISWVSIGATIAIRRGSALCASLSQGCLPKHSAKICCGFCEWQMGFCPLVAFFLNGTLKINISLGTKEILCVVELANRGLVQIK